MTDPTSKTDAELIAWDKSGLWRPVTAQEWNPGDPSMPPWGKPVLVTDGSEVKQEWICRERLRDGVPVGLLGSDTGDHYLTFGTFVNATHWRPWPEPPMRLGMLNQQHDAELIGGGG